jgi:hypothetical protein
MRSRPEKGGFSGFYTVAKENKTQRIRLNDSKEIPVNSKKGKKILPHTTYRQIKTRY